MVNPNELIKKFPLKKWYGKDKDTIMSIKLTADEMCYIFAQLGVAMYHEEENEKKRKIYLTNKSGNGKI